MYRWARKIWSTIAPHERQVLMRSKKPTTQGFYDCLIAGRLPSCTNYPPAVLTPDELRLLVSWKDKASQSLENGQMGMFASHQKMYGLEIPQQWGGIGGSPYFHSRVLRWLSTIDKKANWIHRIMVPNSLGPAQLVQNFGTEKQQHAILPFLSDGSKIPCFGLTGPWNGSDAASFPDIGIIESMNGVEGIRFSCEKRWITLSTVADLLGLAIRVKGHGITLLLIDTTKLTESDRTKIEIRKHHPIGSTFPNGSIQINDLWIPLEDCVIGGRSKVGQGWKMLMDCLHHGRGISLPSVSCGSVSYVAWHTLFYSVVRRQFQQPLVNIGAPRQMISEIILLWYMSFIMNEFYHATLVQGEQSSAFSALMKYVLTTFHREAVLKSMDVFAGRGITEGDRNPISFVYKQMPIAITVEGSNPLTRHIIVPVQSLFEHHPFLHDILSTLDTENEDVVNFYKSVSGCVADVLGHGMTVHRSESRRALFQYYCLLRGHELRSRQDLCRRLNDWIMRDTLLYALQWGRVHFPDFPVVLSDMSSIYCRTIFERGSFELPWNGESPLPETVLNDKYTLKSMEGDLHMDHSSPFFEVRQRWVAGEARTIDSFSRSLPVLLQRQIIDVDSFPLDPPPENSEFSTS